MSAPILHLVASAALGGAEVYVEYAVRAAGGDVVSLADGPMVARWRAAGARVAVVPAPGKLPLGALSSVRRAIERFEPELLCTHTVKANFLGAIAASPGLRRAVFVHGGHAQYGYARSLPAGVYRAADRFAAQGASAVVAVARTDAEALAAAGFPRVRTIPPAVPDPPAPPPRKAVGRGEKKTPLLLWIGRLSAEKNPHAFLDLVARLREDGLDFRARMVGDGPLAPSVRVRAETIGVEAPGAVADLEPEYAAASVVASTSLSEGLPLVALEAAARGLPLVLPDLPSLCVSLPEAVFFPAGEVVCAARAAAGLLLRPERRAAAGAALRERWRRDFRLPRLGRDLEALL